MATNKRMTLLGERAPHVAADHHAIRDITGGDERRTILFLVNPHHCPGEAFFQRQTCPQAVEPINMAFLVNGKYYRLNLRIDREPNEFVNLVNELRIFGQLERRYAGGLPALGASTALNREADGPRHHDAGSTPRFEGRAFEHQSDNVLGDLVSQRADEGGPRRVGKEPVEVFYHEPLLQPPDADRRLSPVRLGISLVPFALSEATRATLLRQTCFRAELRPRNKASRRSRSRASTAYYLPARMAQIRAPH